MPSNKDLSKEDEALLESGGDVKQDTKNRRKRAYEDLDKYFQTKTGLNISDLIEDKNNEEAREVFSKHLGLYFWSYQVKVMIISLKSILFLNILLHLSHSTISFIFRITERTDLQGSGQL